MERNKPLNCDFGEHINQMNKDKIIELCHNFFKDEPVENYKNLEHEDLVKKYQEAWMQNLQQYQ